MIFVFEVSQQKTYKLLNLVIAFLWFYFSDREQDQSDAKKNYCSVFQVVIRAKKKTKQINVLSANTRQKALANFYKDNDDDMNKTRYTPKVLCLKHS